MKEKGLSIAQLERQAGLSIHSVRNFLKGKIKKPRLQFFQAIAAVLECSTMDLLGFSASTPHPSLSSEAMREKKKLLLEDLDLMQECAFVLLNLLKEKKYQISVEDFFKNLKVFYSYSSYKEPQKVDLRFARWIVEKESLK